MVRPYGADVTAPLSAQPPRGPTEYGMAPERMSPQCHPAAPRRGDTPGAQDDETPCHQGV